MRLITPEYRALQCQLHELPYYGSGEATKFWYPMVRMAATQIHASSILDYGCGKGKLAESLPEHIVLSYDPAIPGRDGPPESADLVVCLDVLEHIEPECLGAVLGDIRQLALVAVLFTIATGPAKKTLADGRNAHLIQEDETFWLPKIMQHWDLQHFARRPGCKEFFTFALAKPPRIAAL